MPLAKPGAPKLRTSATTTALTVRLTAPADNGGTHIRWSFRFEPKIPGTGAFMRFYLGRIVAGFPRRLAAYAEKRNA